MKSKSFEWGARKYQSNIRKHGVSFDEVKSVFYDEMALLFLMKSIPKVKKDTFCLV